MPATKKQEWVSGEVLSGEAGVARRSKRWEPLGTTCLLSKSLGSGVKPNAQSAACLRPLGGTIEPNVPLAAFFRSLCPLPSGCWVVLWKQDPTKMFLLWRGQSQRPQGSLGLVNYVSCSWSPFKGWAQATPLQKFMPCLLVSLLSFDEQLLEWAMVSGQAQRGDRNMANIIKGLWKNKEIAMK